MIELRPTIIDDCQFIIKCNEGKDEAFLHQWAGPSYIFPITVEQIKKRLKDTIYTKFFTAFIDNEIIGTVEIGFIDYKKKECKICRFLLEENSRNKGYGTEISKSLINYAFDKLNMNKVSLHVSSNNVSAKKCYEKAGFTLAEEQNKKASLKMELFNNNLPKNI
ncbi:MAG: GNAT family N-acetyltransferase [Sedimentibacter sp.]